MCSSGFVCLRARAPAVLPSCKVENRVLRLSSPEVSLFTCCESLRSPMCMCGVVPCFLLAHAHVSCEGLAHPPAKARTSTDVSRREGAGATANGRERGGRCVLSSLRPR